MINLSLNELKLIAKYKDFKDYENKYEYDLIKTLSEPKTKISFSKKRIKKIREKFNELGDRSSRPETKEIRRNPYDIKNKKVFLHQKWKRLKKILLN